MAGSDLGCTSKSASCTGTGSVQVQCATATNQSLPRNSLLVELMLLQTVKLLPWHSSWTSTQTIQRADKALLGLRLPVNRFSSQAGCGNLESQDKTEQEMPLFT